MTIDKLNIGALIQSPELFESYLTDIQSRREENRVKRLRLYWQEATQRLSAERDAADTDGDVEIAVELGRTIAAFQDALTQSVVGTTVAESSTTEEEANTKEVKASADTSPAMVKAIAAVELPYPNALPPKSDQSPVDEASKVELAEQAAALIDRLTTHLGNEAHGLPHEFSGKALYCEAAAFLLNASVSTEDAENISRLSSDLSLYIPWHAVEFPFDFTSSDASLWLKFSRGYRRCAVAREALSWYDHHLEHIHANDRTRLLSAIAASQKWLFREQESIGARDRVQTEFFKAIADLKDSAGWLAGMDRNTSDSELDALANDCGEVYREIVSSVEEESERLGKQARKDAAVQAIVDWEDTFEGRAITTGTLANDRATLCSLLDECIASSVPPTNLKVRSAIFDTASVLLVDQPKYAKFLDAVLTERKRKNLDAVEVEESDLKEDDDSAFDAIHQTALEFTKGKKILIFGGKSRPRVREDLSQILECELSWPDSEPTDKASKFDSAIKKANVVLLNKNFIRHEMFYRAKDLMGENGGHFIVLPSGYGTRQVVAQIAEYVQRGANGG